MFRRTRQIHFVGIGGIGMSGIAEVLLNLGHRVTGSDLKATNITRRLESLGATVFDGHRPENVAGADVVVISSAVGPDNLEVAAAKQDFIPVIPRAEMLAELMRLKYSVAVAGSHGKTTTTSLVGALLSAAGMDPTLVIGGRLDIIDSNARLGQGEFLVAEADESDGSFLMLSPTIAVVTNIDLEHLDYYRDLDHLKETFLTFINRVPFYGAAVVCLDDPNVQALIPGMKKRYMTYGLSAQADIQAVDVVQLAWGSRYELLVKGENLGLVEIQIPGRHNVLNSLAAVGAALEVGVPIEAIIRGFNQPLAIERRLQFKGDQGGVLVLDDYGHHPTEIRATLATLKECHPERRLVVLFQPHRYSRTHRLFESFFYAFNQADRLIMTEVYPAGEKPIPGVTGQALAESVKQHGHHEAEYVPELDRLTDQAFSEARPGDLILTLGAGNIWRVGEELVERLKSGRKD